MALSDTKIKNLKPRDKAFQLADGRGLFIDVNPGGKKTWRLRYRLDGRQEKVTLGEYPAYSLADARQWCEECRSMVAKGESPMVARRAKKQALKEPDILEPFARKWLTEIVPQFNKNPRNIKRALEKDVFPTIGEKALADVTVGDVIAITDRIKARGSDQAALMTRNILKRLFAYAIARQKVSENPAALIDARFIATARSRDVALTPGEVGKLLRGIYTSSMRRSNKLAIHLLLLCMVRKSSLIEARWEEFDFENSEWSVPEKKGKPHIVYLSNQALAMFEELKTLSTNSEYVLPSPSNLRKHISSSTLNSAIRALNLDIRQFVIHDFRRTASTILHEKGFNSDWIEKCLAHEQKGVRGIYNRAEYSEQRKQLLQWWADFVDTQIEDGRKVILGRFSHARYG